MKSFYGIPSSRNAITESFYAILNFGKGVAKSFSGIPFFLNTPDNLKI